LLRFLLRIALTQQAGAASRPTRDGNFRPFSLLPTSAKGRLKLAEKHELATVILWFAAVASWHPHPTGGWKPPSLARWEACRYTVAAGIFACQSARLPAA
jgi:hypothetical protein